MLRIPPLVHGGASGPARAWPGLPQVVIRSLLAIGVLASVMMPRIGLANDDNDNGSDKRKPNGSSAEQQPLAPAGARPDLLIEYLGYQNPANDQLIRFRVTNVGTARSSAIKARVITLEPEPTPWQRDLDVPALVPGASYDQIYYPLAASCQGHLVRATVDDPQDLPSVNDRVEVRVCPVLPPIIPQSPDPIIDYGASVNDGVPPQLRIGAHTEVFVPSGVTVVGRARRKLEPLASGCLDALPSPPVGLEAGFFNADLSGPFGCTLNIIWQGAFRFDLDLLRRARATGRWFPTDAVLTFTETPYPNPVTSLAGVEPFTWLNSNGDILPTQTCWPRLAVPAIDWGPASRDILANDVVRPAEQIGRWTVYDQILGMIQDPDREHRGFLMLGHNEEMHANNAGCFSRFENVKLTVTYTIR